ncbi:DUF1415 domain-containing protein [Pseudomonas anguilliseptica]|uniref:DUF1415 domain-containing protein n=1 Tax=Pseudomonas anguilliseptica TaxID=53406 RepID=A0A1H4QYT0_PSEAG|nr:DUF1415 domain-containing protein [Pseudomonas anguilliseptica]SEC24806.1 hypothetical protein SAMN05421553_0558 [Pseudomonas anguilliseptica]
MSSTATPSAAHAIAETRAWVDRAVIGLNLCPFAKAVQVKGQVRYKVCASAEPEELLSALIDELHALANCEPSETDTTLLIHPAALSDFLDFNDFLAVVDDTLDDLGYAGILQVASFHPQFQFADTGVNDLSNATNRSPYPTLHILREASIDRAVAAFPDPEAIFEANIQTLEDLGAEGWGALQAQCRKDAQTS